MIDAQNGPNVAAALRLWQVMPVQTGLRDYWYEWKEEIGPTNCLYQFEVLALKMG